MSDPFGRCTAMITRQRGVRQTNIGGDDAARRRSGRPAPETESCQEDDDDAPMSIDASIAASELNYQRLLEWNERYDAKTSIVLTLSTAMLGVVGAMTFGLPANALSFPTVWAAHSAISFPLGACILEVGRHILISILCALWWSHMTRTSSCQNVICEVSRGTRPDVGAPSVTLPHQPKRSLVFFGTTAAMDVAEFHSAILTRSKSEYLADLVSQQHTNSRILSAKFGCLGRSYRWDHSEACLLLSSF